VLVAANQAVQATASFCRVFHYLQKLMNALNNERKRENKTDQELH